MGRYFLRRLSLIILCSVAAAAGAETSSIDWEGELLIFSVSTSIPEGPDIPQAAFGARQQLAPIIPELFAKKLAPLIIDSLYSLQDHYLRTPNLLHEVSELSQQFTERFSHLSADTNTFQQAFTLRYHETLLPLFTTRPREDHPPYIPVWIPEQDFSGLVIYAADALPLYGTSRQEFLQPALLPEVYSPDIELLHGYRYMNRTSLHQWGVAAYTTSPDETEWISRIGLRPLRIIATGIFGKNPSDLIVTQAAAQMIRQSPSLLTALNEGRVLIIAPSRSPTNENDS